MLAVDDDELLREMVAFALRKNGRDVITAASGEEALGYLERQAFDVVVSDVGMGAGMNGWQLEDHVRDRWPDVRFLLATGWGPTVDRELARARGIDDVLSKPYRVAELEAAVQAA